MFPQNNTNHNKEEPRQETQTVGSATSRGRHSPCSNRPLCSLCQQRLCSCIDASLSLSWVVVECSVFQMHLNLSLGPELLAKTLKKKMEGIDCDGSTRRRNSEDQTAKTKACTQIQMKSWIGLKCVFQNSSLSLSSTVSFLQCPFSYV